MYTDIFGNRRYKINLHTHTTVSDGHRTPAEAAKIYKNAGYDAIALTDHWIFNEGTELEGLGECLAGTTALATSDDDYVAAARILSKYASKHENFKIKSGFLDNEVISLEKIDSLAKLPSREVLLATVCSVFQAPIAAFARGVQAIVDKNGETAEAAAE